MKKQLLALAVAAALPMGAQAGVTIYGHAHASFDYTDNGTDSRADVSSNSSRLGFKGTEDLSDNLAVFWKMEWQVSLSGDGARGRDLAQRNRYVGLKGGFGSVLLGRHDLPTKIIGRKVDLFYSTQLGENRNLTAGDFHGGGLDARVDNVVAYISPTFGGFHIVGAYTADPYLGTTAPENDMDGVDIAAIFSKGGFFAAASYGNVDGSRIGADDLEWYRLTGSAKFGGFRVVGLYQDFENDLFGDRKAWGLGGSFSFGKNVVKAHYYVADDRANVSSTGAEQISVGFDHKVNKRTMLYATYSMIDNDSGASYGFGNAGHDDVTSPATGDDVDGLSLGLRYTF